MLELVTAATDDAEPVSLDEAKAHLNIEHGDDDALIRALTRSARRSIEDKTGLALAIEEWRETFPNAGLHSLDVSRRPVTEIVSVEWRSTEESAYSDIKADFRLDYGAIRRKSTAATYFASGDDNALRVQYRAGLERDRVPDAILAAVKLQLGFLYANRGDNSQRDAVEDPSNAIMSLIGPWRRLGA